MKIAIISDIHDHLQNLEKCLTQIEDLGIENLIFCGDYCSPVPVKLLNNFKGNVHSVFGNGDGDRFTISNKSNGNIIHYGEYGEFSINDCSICITHYPFYGEALASTGQYHLVCAGHTHQPFIKKIDSCYFVNPGDLLGLFDNPTYAIYDTNLKEVEIREL